MKCNESEDADIEKWHDVCAVGDCGIQVLECDGRFIFATVENSKWRIFDARCPHHGTNLGFCEVRGTVVECPLHGWQFDLKDGRCTRFGTQDLAEFKTRIDASRVQAWW